MKILFVYPNITRVHRPQLGICSIAAVARDLGHECHLYDLATYEKEEWLSAFQSKLDSFRPDLIAVSCRSNEWPFLRRLFHSVNTGKTLKIFGGPHATAAPEEVIEIADVLVMGEGEKTFSELLKTLMSGKDITGINGCWVKHGESVIKNKMQELILNLDELPMPYWELFDNCHYYSHELADLFPRARVIGTFEGSRGCPYACTYCSNSYIRELYEDKGNWRREKSPERIIQEVQLFRDLYGLDAVVYVDEIMLTNISRLEKFRDLYASKIGLPYHFMERPENMTGEKVSIARQAGARIVSIGIESGDENLRRNLLNRRHSQQAIISAFRVAKEHGLTTFAFTMVGFPGEDRHSIRETFRLLKESGPDTVQASTFYPLAGTKLRELVVAQGLFNPRSSAPERYYFESTLNYPKKKQKELLRYQYLIVNYKSISLWMLGLVLRSEFFFLLLQLYLLPGKAPSRLFQHFHRLGIRGLMKGAYRKFQEKGLFGLLRTAYRMIAR